MNWSIVSSLDELAVLQRHLAGVRRFAFDTETTGLRWWRDTIFLMSFCDGEKAWLVPRKHFQSERLSEFFMAVFQDPDKEVLGQNIKFDLNFVWSDFKAPCARKMLDTKIMAHLLNENRPNGLKPLAKSVLGIEPKEEAAVKEWLEGHFKTQAEWDYSKVPDAIMYPYSVQDAILTWKLAENLEPQIIAEFAGIFQMETELMPVVIEMERVGVPVNVAYLQQLQGKFTPEVAGFTQAFQEAGKPYGLPEDFNIASHPQLSEFLYQTLKLPIPFFTRKGAPAVSADALGKLKHPIVGHLKAFSYTNSRLKFVENLLEYADGTGMIHANFNTTGTVSGRMSCSEPNLQNVSNDAVILRAFDTEVGMSMLHFDYSLLEMIPMAIYSKDATMLGALREKRDLHRLTAAEVLRVPYEDVTKEQRQCGKGSNFAIVFGVGKAKFTDYVNGYMPEGSKLTVDEGLAFRERYHRVFPGPRRLMKQVQEVIHSRLDCSIKGHFGRVRRLPPYINTQGKAIDPAFQGVNYLCQNWGADLMKYTMVKLKKGVLKDVPIRQQIHDDLRIDTKLTGKARDEFVREVSRTMCDWPEFDVPLRTECKWSDQNWAELKTYEEAK